MNKIDKIILPEKYYLDYFKYVLDFVNRKYLELLNAEEKEFIQAFQELSEDAQCLYVRISNRKGKFFRLKKLEYSEIQNKETAHHELIGKGYCDEPDYLELEELYQLIHVFTKPEIISRLKKTEETLDWKLPKPELIMQSLEVFSHDFLFDQFYQSEPVVVQGKKEILDMIKLFFFGHNHGDMTDFVIRDIGHAKFIEVDESKLGVSFNTREEAEAVKMLSNYQKEFYILEEMGDPVSIISWFDALEMDYFLALEKAKSRADKLIHRVGYFLERQKLHEEAIRIYRLSQASPMRERQIRIYNKEKNPDAALSVAKEILENPNDSKEYYIAQDVIHKSTQKLKSTTIRQKKGLEIDVPISYQYNVEAGTLAHFENLGYQGIHSENTLWRTIFGIVFWEEIFDPSYHTLHQPLQRNPTDLYSKEFYENRKEAVHQKLKSLRTKKQVAERMMYYYENNRGLASIFVNWDESCFQAALRLVNFLKPKQVKETLLEMALDPKTKSSGFPDLFVWKENEYHFYEVKSPTDHLSEKQLFWLEHFKKHQIHAEIVLVKWV